MINLIYDNVIYSLQKSGGISVYWKELTERIIKNNSIYLEIMEYPDAENNIFRKQIKFNESQIRTLSPFPSINFKRYINLRIKNNKMNIFHSSYYRIARGSNIKNIVTVHDFTYEKKMNNLIGKLHILQKRNALRKADGIICVSENTKNDMLEIYPTLCNKKIEIIYNGFNSDDYKCNKNAQIEDTTIFVGGRKDYKNFDKAVEAVSGLNNITLTIVGAPLEPGEKTLLDELLPNRYKVFSHISNDDLNMLYNQSICLLYLSEYEGFGIPVLEAMSAGCPVIALNKSSIPEVAGEAGILFENYNKENIQKAIKALQFNGKLRTEQIELGMNNSKKYSWDRCYKEVLVFYDKIISGDQN